MRFLYMIGNFIQMLFVTRTVGVKALVLKENQVLLVKHTYIPGWHLIGGGVDLKESPIKGMIRELKEEADITAHEDMKLFGVYYNVYQKHDDYVIFYICTNFEEGPSIDSQEIQAKKWFPLNDLPADIAPSSLRRIQEYLKQHPVSDQW